MSTKVRHWKQHFDPDADLVFRKRLALGFTTADGERIDVVQPGDPVTDEMKAAFGKHRFKVWWRGGFIELAPEPITEAVDEVPPTVEETGKGWYTVRYPDGTSKRVRGKKAVEALLGAQS